MKFLTRGTKTFGMAIDLDPIKLPLDLKYFIKILEFQGILKNLNNFKFTQHKWNCEDFLAPEAKSKFFVTLYKTLKALV